MSIVGESDERELVGPFLDLPFTSAVVVGTRKLFTDRAESDDFIGSGVQLSPLHVLTAGHNFKNFSRPQYDEDFTRAVLISSEAYAEAPVGTTSYLNKPANQVDRITLGQVNFLRDYDATRSANDDVALVSLSSPLRASIEGGLGEFVSFDNSLGLKVFESRDDMVGLAIETAGYPAYYEDSDGGRHFSQFVRSPGEASAPGEIVIPSSNLWQNGPDRFAYSQDTDTSGGQSGSGVWHTLQAQDWGSITEDDTQPLVLGVHTNGAGPSGFNSGVRVQLDDYAAAQAQIAADFQSLPNIVAGLDRPDGPGGWLHAIFDLPQNTLVGSSDSSFIVGTGRDERFILEKGGGGGSFWSFLPFVTDGTPTNSVWSRGGDDIVLGGADSVDRVLINQDFNNYTLSVNLTPQQEEALQGLAAGGQTAPVTAPFTIDPGSSIPFAFGGIGAPSVQTVNVDYAVFNLGVEVNDGFEAAFQNYGTNLPFDINNLPEGSFFVPLRVDPANPDRIADGPDVVWREGSGGDTLSVTAPAWTFDDTVEFSFNLGLAQTGSYNIAYIVDTSGSMRSDGRLAAAQAAFSDLTQFFIDNGISDNALFSVAEFNAGARLYPDLTALEALDVINGLRATGLTNYDAGLAAAEGWFEGLTGLASATNVAYFLADGGNNRGAGPSDRLQTVTDRFGNVVDVEVKAFGIPPLTGAGKPGLDIIDSSGNSVILQDQSDLADAFQIAGGPAQEVSGITVTVTPEGDPSDVLFSKAVDAGDLAGDAAGGRFTGTLSGLGFGPGADVNIVTVEVSFVDTNIDPIVTTAKIGSGQSEIRSQSEDGTEEVVIFSASQRSFEGGALNETVYGNEMSNTFRLTGGENIVFGGGGNNTFLVEGGGNTIQGGRGTDTAVFFSTIESAGGVTQRGGRTEVGGEHVLTNVEFLEFTDMRLSTSGLEAVPLLTLSEQTLTAREGQGEPVEIEIVMSQPAGPDGVDLQIETRDGAAREGVRYEGLDEVVRVQAGETRVTVALNILNDDIVTGDGEFFVNITALSGATFADGETRRTVMVETEENDALARLVAVGDDTRIPVGDATGVIEVPFFVERVGDLDRADEVVFEVVPIGEDAAGANEFSGGFPSGIVTFAPGEALGTFTVSLSPDAVSGTNTTFGVQLSGAGGLITGQDPVEFTILRDDPFVFGPPQEDPVDTPAIAIAGIVRDTNGNPLSGLTLHHSEAGEVVVGADGRFEFELPKAAPGVLTVSGNAPAGTLSMDDGIAVLRAAMGLAQPDGFEFIAADVNRDGVVDGADAQAIFRHVAGLYAEGDPGGFALIDANADFSGAQLGNTVYQGGVTVDPADDDLELSLMVLTLGHVDQFAFG